MGHYLFIKPLLKKSDPSHKENYHSISLLPAFSKIFEYIMYDKISKFLNKYQIINSGQNGYILNKNVNTANFKFMQYVSEALENGDLSFGIFLDLSKAFDCVDHTILLDKLFKYGLRSKVFYWIKSNLVNRKQCVILENNNIRYYSDTQDIKKWVHYYF